MRSPGATQAQNLTGDRGLSRRLTGTEGGIGGRRIAKRCHQRVEIVFPGAQKCRGFEAGHAQERRIDVGDAATGVESHESVRRYGKDGI